MNCNGFESELRKAVERREAAARSDLREHARVCPRCAPQWERHELLEQAVAAWQGTIPPIDLADRVMAHWAFDGGAEFGQRLAPEGELAALHGATAQPADDRAAAARPQAGRRRFANWAAVAAAVAVIAILAAPLLWRAADQPSENPRMADASSSPEPADTRPNQPTLAPTVRLDRAVREAGSVWLGLASEATGTVREMAAFLPEQALASAAQPEVEVRLPQPARWTEKLKNEIAPIQRDVGRAMDFLLEAVPLSRNRAI